MLWAAHADKAPDRDWGEVKIHSPAASGGDVVRGDNTALVCNRKGIGALVVART